MCGSRPPDTTRLIIAIPDDNILMQPHRGGGDVERTPGDKRDTALSPGELPPAVVAFNEVELSVPWALGITYGQSCTGTRLRMGAGYPSPILLEGEKELRDRLGYYLFINMYMEVMELQTMPSVGKSTEDPCFNAATEVDGTQ